MKEKYMDDKHVKRTIAYRFFVFDTYLNWGLGFLFLFFYKYAEKWMSAESLLPDYLWICIGAVFMVFAWWQTYVLTKNIFGRFARFFGFATAWLSVLVLTYALVFMDFDLFVEARLIIWVGNFYMFILGGIYLRSYLKL
jgi:hypothetical protein